jgi:hypothetical protein
MSTENLKQKISETQQLIEKYSDGLPEWNKPEHLLYNFFTLVNDAPQDGINDVCSLIEQIIKFFLMPKHLEAFHNIPGEVSEKDLAVYLPGMLEMFNHMKNLKVVSIFESIDCRYLVNEEQANGYANQYRLQLEIEATEKALKSKYANL